MKLNINLSCLSESSPRYLPKSHENICLQEALPKNVHSNFIYDSRKVEKKSKGSLAREMTNRLLFIHTMEYLSAIERNKLLVKCGDIW